MPVAQARRVSKDITWQWTRIMCLVYQQQSWNEGLANMSGVLLEATLYTTPCTPISEPQHKNTGIFAGAMLYRWDFPAATRI